jgi:hydroxymethylglutaryl-CoA synthase
LQELHLVLAYGSGSIKSFEGTIQQDWQLALVNTNLFQTLEKSNPIDFITYEKLHKRNKAIAC